MPLQSICEHCGSEFTHYPSQKKRFCSRACYEADRANTVIGTCPECGKEFPYLASWPRKYCSNECKGKNTVSNIKRWKPTGYQTVCEECGVEFRATKATRGRFCSLKCYGTWQSKHIRGKRHPTYGRKFGRAKHLPPPTMITCPVCNTEFAVKPSAVKRRRFCSKECHAIQQSEVFTGPNSLNWRGGYRSYYGPSWHPARRAVLKRDVVCQECGISPEELGRELDVHHICAFREFGVERHEEANDPANLIALCNVCHIRREHAEGTRPKVLDIQK